MLHPLPGSEYPDRGSFWNLRKDRKSGNRTRGSGPGHCASHWPARGKGWARAWSQARTWVVTAPWSPRAAQMSAPPRLHSSPGQQQRALQRRRQATQTSGPRCAASFPCTHGLGRFCPRRLRLSATPMPPLLPMPAPHHGGLSRSAGPSTPPSLTSAPIATRHLAGSTLGAQLAWLGTRPGAVPREPGLIALHARQTQNRCRRPQSCWGMGV